MSILVIIGSVFLLLGTVICIIGGIGLVRMPDFYTRAHAASIPDTLGAGLALVGMACFTMDIPGTFDYHLLVIIKLLSISVLILVTSPIAGHAVAKAAFERGVCTNSAPLSLKLNQLCSADQNTHLEDESGSKEFQEDNSSVQPQPEADPVSSEQSTEKEQGGEA